MDHQKPIWKLGALAVSFALFLHLFGGITTLARQFFQDPQVLSFAVFLQTGRIIRYPAAATQPTVSTDPTSAPTQPPTAPPTEPSLPVMATDPTEPTGPSLPDKPTFSAGDLEKLSLIYGCNYRPDLEALLLSPLNWDLYGDEPTVLIVHTHATESYAPTEDADYTPSGDRRTLEEAYNMLSIGDEIASILEAGGISVLHDRALHDYPSYNGSYVSARASIAAYLEQYPSIRLVLDIHRDAATSESGTHLTTSATVNGEKASQLMVVIGTDSTGNYHPNWQENLALGLKLTAQLERINPGITRPLYLRAERFNMDLTSGSLLIEVGASGDTHHQALLAAQVLAQGILELARGSE